MMPARRLPNGLLQPWAQDFLNGLREQQRLRDLGLELHLDHGQVAALGHALEGEAVGQYWTRDPVLTDEAVRILDRIVAERATTDYQSVGSAWSGGDCQPPPSTPGPGTADDNGQSSQASPDPVPLFRPKILDRSELDRGARGRADTAARQHKQNPGKIDPIKQYLRDVPDPEDEEWSPTP